MHDNVRALPMAARHRPQDSALPRLPVGHITRQRLSQRLLASDARLTLISAAAGFGKSVLLNECARQAANNTRLVWLDLLGHPLSPAELLARVAAALQMSPGEGDPCAELSQLLGRVEQPLWIILDDYPRQPCAELDACLDHLLERAPHTLRWWISGRRRPAWNLPRLLLQGDLLELDAQSLALDNDELQRLLRQRQLQLPDELLEQLLEHSEGWLAGICLLLIDGDAHNLTQRLNAGTPLLLDYLQREVLSELPEPLLHALRILAHMPRFCTALCEHLLEDESGPAVLEQLRQRQLFLRSLDGCGKWFRLWRPLATMLKQLPGSLTPHQAHVHACQWFAQRGEVREAVEHALWAEQPEVAANYLQRYGQDQLLIGHSVAQFLHWRDELPASLFASTPRLIMLHAWALIICARLDEADLCIAGLSRFLPQPDARRQQQLIAQYQAVLGVLQRQRGLRSAGQHCLEALAVLNESGWAQRILCHQALAQQAMIEGDLDNAQQHNREGLRLARQRGNRLFEALLSVDRSHFLAMLGEPGRALEQAEQAIQELRSADLRGPMLARLLLLRGSLLASQGATLEADEVLQAGLAEAEKCEDAYLLFGYQGLAELAALRGQFERSQQLLRKAERQMQWLQVPEVRYREVLLLSQGHLWLQQGELDNALACFQAVCQRMLNERLLAPSGFYDLQLRARHLNAHTRLLLGQQAAASAELRSLQAEFQHSGHRRLAAECSLSLAEAQFLGEQREADDSLRQAVAEAERLTLRRPLQSLYQRRREWLERVLPAATWQHFLLPTETPPNLALEPRESLLSKRELAVLELIAQGCSNLQIAEQLYISLHTVKTHARRINVKLGVERRTQAVARAKAEGWIG
ncbi:helix-turn-helix transcriptional regulator [Pseudomonas alcaligenes]|uniref:Helix-turn-helix transcriptional regulator n=1 Tax=Aquipseudomonas alcaligenes TaxID=43263 RepID=A0ABR7RUJ0_AQUAC|nr:LuxR C-terminal-related transcriptional regulator [Pseudomonas alcaligenes]MBC9248825.1 helix-turn-helix transcriptional regulator [Pseudomonas alcaligenes]